MHTITAVQSFTPDTDVQNIAVANTFMYQNCLFSVVYNPGGGEPVKALNHSVHEGELTVLENITQVTPVAATQVTTVD